MRNHRVTRLALAFLIPSTIVGVLALAACSPGKKEAKRPATKRTAPMVGPGKLFLKKQPQTVITGSGTAVVSKKSEQQQKVSSPPAQ